MTAEVPPLRRPRGAARALGFRRRSADPAVQAADVRASEPLAPATTAPIVLAGRYELRRVLGSGGEANVYAAHDGLLGREVAVKVFHSRVAPPDAGSLERVEARVSASLNHYALTTLLDAGIDEGPEGRQLYLVMEYVPGEALNERLRRGPMTPADACWLGFDIAEGLDHMHQVGFLHRDVKPSNILISGLRSARPVVAKLTDFGIAARVGEPDLSEFTTGTAAYLSPEQVEGLDAEPASDVYSLGLVMIEAITGRVVFPGSVTRSAFARLDRDPEIPEGIPPRLADLLRRMTARRPADRVGLYDLAVELQQILVDMLLELRPGGAAPAAEPPVVDGPPQQASAAFDAALRLLLGASGATAAIALLGDPAAGQTVAARAGAATASPEGLPVLRAARSGAVLVEDAWQDRDLRAHPLVLGGGVRAVAAVPLQNADRTVAGSLVLLDRAPRAWDDAARAALEDTAALLVADLGLRRAVRRALSLDD
ncbi:serine/threonine-protein kinase [Amnibacterium setariae]|uniref:serine/threonine-protein kinase n=1 Tax=Amnibacterium setariae TaxID=2306585 RepID=UPI0011C47181|nr:serine/threonine-protein kinase [Amnibacterium setariae]